MIRTGRPWLLAQLGVTGLLLALVLRDFDWGELLRLAAELPPWFHPLAFLVLGGGQLLFALRWKLVLAAMGRREPFGELARIHFVGLLFNNFLPTAVGGDAARVYELGRRRGYSAATASVLVDRLLGMLAASASAWALMYSAGPAGSAVAMARAAVGLVALGLATLVLLSVLLPRRAVAGLLVGLRRRLGRPVRRAGPARRLVAWRRGLRGALWLPLGAGVLVVAYYALLAMLYAVYVALVVPRAPAPGTSLLALVMAIGVLANVPVSVNGIGVREQLHVLLLATVGVPKEAAVGLSLLVFGQMLLLSCVGYPCQARAAAPGQGPVGRGRASARRRP